MRLSVTRPTVPDTKALGCILAGRKEERERTLVLVCLPPKWVEHLTESSLDILGKRLILSLMKPLCGLLEPNFDQGPVTGLLAEMGMTSRNVWKLE